MGGWIATHLSVRHRLSVKLDNRAALSGPTLDDFNEREVTNTYRPRQASSSCTTVSQRKVSAFKDVATEMQGNTFSPSVVDLIPPDTHH